MVNLLFSIEHFLNKGLLAPPLRRLSGIPARFRSPVIILAVLSLSTVFGAALSLVGYRRGLLLLILIPAAGAVLLIERHPPMGLAALLITALLIPSPTLPGGFNFAVLLLIALIGLWLLTMVIRREIQLVASRTILPALALSLATALTFAFGQLHWFSFARHSAPLDAQIGGVAIFLLAVGTFLLVAHWVRELRWLEWLTWLFLALGAMFIAGWLVPGVGWLTDRLFQNGTYNNSMFWTWLAVLAFSQAYLNCRLGWFWRLALAGLFIATMYVAFILNRDWKSGYLPPMAAVAVVVGLRSWKAGLAMLVVGPFAAYYLSSDAVATDQYSYSTRLDAWFIVLEMIKTNPILGFGPANYSWYTPLFPIRGYAVRFNSHNQYLDIMAQTGLLGLFCVFWFFGEAGWLGWRLRQRVPEGFAQAYVYGVLGGLAGTLVAGMLADWFLPYVYNIGLTGFRASMLPWFFLGGLVSLEQIVRTPGQVH